MRYWREILLVIITAILIAYLPIIYTRTKYPKEKEFIYRNDMQRYNLYENNQNSQERND